MKDRCDKIKDRLSAYLDGELSPEEMAEIAAHLETCRDCSALLEKMRRLDDMAEKAVPEFDDEMMDSLTGRIMDGIDAAPASTGETASEPKVIPIWYRYVAVAASIVIVFLAGRMAFKESGGNLLSPPARYEITAPAAEDTMMPYEESEGRLDRTEETKSGAPAEAQKAKDEKSAPSTIHNEAVQSRQIQVPVAKVQEVPAPATVENSPEAEDLAEEVKPKAAADMAEKMSPEKPREKSAPVGKIAGKIVDAETGKPLPGVTVQLSGTTIGAKSDIDGDYTIQSVPPDTYNLTYSSTGYESIELTDVPVYPGQTEEMTVALKQAILETGNALTVRGGRAGAGVYQFSTPNSTTEEAPLPEVDSLDARYASLIGPLSARVQKTSAYKKSGAPARRLEDLLRNVTDSLTSGLTEAKDPAERMELSYLRLRTAIDLYNASGKAEDKGMLDKYEADFNKELTDLEEQGYDPKILETYRNRLEKMRRRE